MQTLRKNIITIVVLVGLGALIWWGINYYLSFQKLVVTFDSTTVGSITLYHTAGPTSSTTVGQPVGALSSGVIYKVRNGSYLLRPAGPKTDTTDTLIMVQGSPVTKNLDLDYSSSYLAQLLPAQQTAINSAIYATNPAIARLYVANPGALFHYGEWYGTTLSYIGSDTLSRDTLRLVMHLENGTWVLVSNPPQIYLRAPSYPTVPIKVLSRINAIDIGVPTIKGQ